MGDMVFVKLIRPFRSPLLYARSEIRMSADGLATAVRLFQATERPSTKAAFRRDAARVRSQCFLERVDWPIQNFMSYIFGLTSIIKTSL